MEKFIDKIEAILVTVGQRDRRFKLGETIRYSPSEVAKILREHKDELEAEA